MMNNLTPYSGLLLLALVASGKKHEHYDRTTALAKLYRQLFLGENIDELVLQYSPREDQTNHDFRKKAAEQLSPSWAQGAITQYGEIFRVPPQVKKFNYSSNNNTDELQPAVDNFFGASSVDDYLEEVFHELSMVDPNAFVVVDIGPFDYTKELAKPFPLEISSENAYWVGLENDIVNVVVANMPGWKYEKTTDKGKQMVDGNRYVLYAAGFSLIFEQVDVALVPGEAGWYGIRPELINDVVDDNVGKSIFESAYYKLNEQALFKVNYAFNGLKNINVVRTGFKRDRKTKGKTFISALHPAVPYYKASVKRVSEMEITMLNHVFQQKLQYVESCSVDPNGNCVNSGELKASCSKCAGKGVLVHKSGNDVITLPLPKIKGQINKEALVPLNELIHYVSPNIEIAKFQDEKIMQLMESSFTAIFTSQSVIKGGIENTAAAKRIEKEHVYNTLYPYAQKIARTWVSFINLIASWRQQAEGLHVEYIIPEDFKLLSLDELIEQYKLATEAKVPAIVRRNIVDDIVAKQYSDQPEALKKYRVRQLFSPFQSKDDTEVKFLIASNLVSTYDAVLYANFDKIFNDIEAVEAKFYDYDYTKQKKIIDDAVSKIQADIDKQKGQTAVPFGQQ